MGLSSKARTGFASARLRWKGQGRNCERRLYAQGQSVGIVLSGGLRVSEVRRLRRPVRAGFICQHRLRREPIPSASREPGFDGPIGEDAVENPISVSRAGPRGTAAGIEQGKDEVSVQEI